jgi:glycine betaine/proline transport system substrate-binding protein
MNSIRRQRASCSAGLILAVLVFVAGQANAETQIPESTDPIRLALNEWTGQHITTKIAGEVLREMGYNVEYVTAGYIPQLEGIGDGNIAATLELWEQTIGEHYTRALESGDVVPMGDTGVVTREGFIYPPYLEEECPGLPDYEALNECAQHLATSDTYPKGRVIDYPVDWDPDTSQRLEGLQLDYVAQPPGSEGAAVAEIRSAVARNQPILVTFWQPHWLFSEYDMNWVELPESAPDCYGDPSWGPNPDRTHDCGWPAGWVRKVAWSGMEDKWPGAYRFLRVYQIDNAIQGRLMYRIDVEEVPLEKAVSEWMSNNRGTWEAWIAKAMNQ